MAVAVWWFHAVPWASSVSTWQARKFLKWRVWWEHPWRSSIHDGFSRHNLEVFLHPQKRKMFPWVPSNVPATTLEEVSQLQCTQQNKANMSHVLGWLVAEDILADAPEVPCHYHDIHDLNILKPINQFAEIRNQNSVLKKGTWLVVSNLFLLGFHHPNWLTHIFRFRRVVIPPTRFLRRLKQTLLILTDAFTLW